MDQYPLHAAKAGLSHRLAELTARGQVIPAEDPERPVDMGECRPGALQRFLDDRQRDVATPLSVRT